MKREQVKKLNNMDKRLNSRASELEYKQVEKKAIKYAKGNMSDWIRMASLNYEPKD